MKNTHYKRKANRTNTHDMRRGLSLVEVSISTLIVGLMLVTALKCVGGVFQTNNAAASKYDGVHLADQLHNEILHSHYEEPDDAVSFGIEGIESSAVRTAWDDVDDFIGWSNSPPVDRDGAAITGASSWTRTVAVRLVEIGDPTVTASSDVGLKEITVTAVHSNGETVTRKALRSKVGMLEHASLVDSTWITAVDLEITTGAVTVSGGVSMSNAPEDN